MVNKNLLTNNRIVSCSKKVKKRAEGFRSTGNQQDADCLIM